MIKNIKNVSESYLTEEEFENIIGEKWEDVVDGLGTSNFLTWGGVPASNHINLLSNNSIQLCGGVDRTIIDGFDDKGNPIKIETGNKNGFSILNDFSIGELKRATAWLIYAQRNKSLPRNEMVQSVNSTQGQLTHNVQAFRYDNEWKAIPWQTKLHLRNSQVIAIAKNQKINLDVRPEDYVRKDEIGNIGGAENFAELENDTTVSGNDGKEVINNLDLRVSGNTNDIDLNNTEIGTNATAIDINTKKLVNVNTDGTVKDIIYDPDDNPNQFATKKMIKDNTGGVNPELEKHLDYSDKKEITIFGLDKNKPGEGSYIKLDSQEISIGVNNSNILTLLDNGTNKAATIDANLQLNSHKIGGVSPGTSQTDAVNLQQLNEKGLPPELEKRIKYDIPGLTYIYAEDKADIRSARILISNGRFAVSNDTNTTLFDVLNNYIDVHNKPIRNVSTPYNDEDAATKEYVDTRTQSYKDMTSEVANKLITVKQPTLVLINQYNWNEFELCDYNNLEQFTVGRDTYITDRFKIVLYGIKGTKYSGKNTTKAKAVFYFDINDINVWSVEKENEVLAEVFLPDRNENVGAFQIRIRFTFYRKNNKFYINFLNGESSASTSVLQNVSLSLFAIKLKGINFSTTTKKKIKKNK